MKRQTPIYQHCKGDMRGDLFTINLEDKPSYYYKIYFLINGKYKLISQSYVNVFDRELCMERMLHDMDIIDTSRLKRLN